MTPSKNETEATTTEINQLGPDFSEVDWKVAPESLANKIDYGSLNSVKALMEGTPLEIPANTQLARLYRYMTKQGYKLHRRKTGSNSVVIWADRVSEPE